MSRECNANQPSPSLQAEYRSPSSSKTFIHVLPSSTFSTAEKSQYLSALRQSVTQLQEDVNAFLTSKMEDDRALASKDGLKVDDKKEEENYGEEGVGDDA